jgi:hypothetical protein
VEELAERQPQEGGDDGDRVQDEEERRRTCGLEGLLR